MRIPAALTSSFKSLLFINLTYSLLSAAVFSSNVPVAFVISFMPSIMPSTVASLNGLNNTPSLRNSSRACMPAFIPDATFDKAFERLVNTNVNAGPAKSPTTTNNWVKLSFKLLICPANVFAIAAFAPCTPATSPNPVIYSFIASLVFFTSVVTPRKVNLVISPTFCARMPNSFSRSFSPTWASISASTNWFKSLPLALATSPNLRIASIFGVIPVLRNLTYAPTTSST